MWAPHQHRSSLRPRWGQGMQEKLSLPALLSLYEAPAALTEAGGALMEIDESTPKEVSALMAKGKYVQDCFVLKTKALSDSFPEGSVAHTAVTRLETAKDQYLEATQQLDELPEEATDEDRDKVKRQKPKVQVEAVFLASQAVFLASHVLHALLNPTEALARQLAD